MNCSQILLGVSIPKTASETAAASEKALPSVSDIAAWGDC
jgi:hypothetical protein